MTTRTCTSKTPMTTHTCTYMIMHDDHHPLNFGDDMSKKYKNISMHVVCVTVQIQCNISEKTNASRFHTNRDRQWAERPRKSNTLFTIMKDRNVNYNIR